MSLAANGANANYFANVVQTAWTSYATTPLAITLNGRQFSGSATGAVLRFTEANPAAANVGESFTVQQPSTQDLLGCSGTMASGVAVTAAANTAQATMEADENAVQLQLENQICAATNRGVLLTRPTGRMGAPTTERRRQTLLAVLAQALGRRVGLWLLLRRQQ